MPYLEGRVFGFGGVRVDIAAEQTSTYKIQLICAALVTAKPGELR